MCKCFYHKTIDVIEMIMYHQIHLSNFNMLYMYVIGIYVTISTYYGDHVGFRPLYGCHFGVLALKDASV